MRVERPAIHASSAARVMVQSFMGLVESTDIRAAFLHFEEIVARDARRKHGAITITTSARLAPTAELAREIATWQRRIASKTSASAIVIEGDAFGAVTARTALGSVNLFARALFRQASFRERRDAVAWIGGHVDLSELEQAEVLACADEVVTAHRRFLGK